MKFNQGKSSDNWWKQKEKVNASFIGKFLSIYFDLCCFLPVNLKVAKRESDVVTDRIVRYIESVQTQAAETLP